MGGETGNRAEMANRVSQEIFGLLGWEREGPVDQNWKCVTAEHEKKTHPTDIVFSYLDPYDSSRVYINCDLKSYGASSIKPATVAEALESLSLATDCAQRSEEWQTKYLRSDSSSRILGLLFIYNHDASFDRSFGILLETATEDRLPVARGNRLFVFSPQEVCRLKTICTDILASRGSGELPGKDLCTFFFPDQQSRVVIRSSWQLPVTIENLKSSKLVLKHKSSPSVADYDGLTIYYFEKGTLVEEFIYLIDYLFHWQMVKEGVKITIKLTEPAIDAHAVFGRAIKDYAARYGVSQEMSTRLQAIVIRTVQQVVTHFSEVAIGMDR